MITIDWQVTAQSMITIDSQDIAIYDNAIDWQVTAQYDNDRLTSDRRNMITIDWQVIAQNDNDRLRSNVAIWWR